MCKISEREYLVSARIELNRLEERLGLQLTKGNYTTLAGYLLGKAREVPGVGAVIESDCVTFAVKRATPQAIQKVRLRW